MHRVPGERAEGHCLRSPSPSITATLAQLVELFGNPAPGATSPTRCEWVIEWEEGATFSIYEWDEDTPWKTPDQPYDWPIASRGEDHKHTPGFIAELTQLLKETSHA